MKVRIVDDSLILLVCIYLIAIFLMGSFNIVETVLPYYTEGLPIYNYVKVSISLIYLSLAFSNIVSIKLLRRYDIPRLLLLGVSGYLVYTIASIVLNNVVLILAGLFLGFTASIYWLTTRLAIYYEVSREKLGRAFGLLSCLVLISSGIFPYLSLAIYHTLMKSLLLALMLYVPIMIFLVVLIIKCRGRKLVQGNLALNGQIFDEFRSLLRIGSVRLLLILAFSNSYLLPLVVMYSPLISKTNIELANIRLFSYAIPSLASLIGGSLYDALGPKVLLVILLIPLLVPLINLYPILMIGLLVFIQNIYAPALQAHIGKVLAKEYLDKVLAITGLIGTISTSINMYIIPTLTQYSNYLTISYIVILSVITSIVTTKIIT